MSAAYRRCVRYSTFHRRKAILHFIVVKKVATESHACPVRPCVGELASLTVGLTTRCAGDLRARIGGTKAKPLA